MSSKLKFFDKMKILREIIPNYEYIPSALVEIKKLLDDIDIRREFFQNLEQPEWIVPLRNEGYFDNPPKAEKKELGKVHYPNWPASKYLARMAKYVPSEVADIFVAMETDNASIIGDMIEAAQAMPADVVVTLVPTVCRVAREGILWIYFKEAVELSLSLVDGSEMSAAMTLVEVLFTPSLSEEQAERNQMDEYWYAEGLKKIVPVFAEQEEVTYRFLSMSCKWLEIFVRAMKFADLASGFDNSHLWRPAIEEHEQNNDYELAAVMVGFVREGFERSIRKNALSLSEALEIINRHHYLVFKRLRIHLINEFTDENRELARRTIMNHELFKKYNI